MDKEMFDELLASVQEMDDIVKGKEQPSRKFEFPKKDGIFMSIDQIASEALRLNPRDRAILAETIWESLEDPYIVFSNISDEEAIALAKQRDKEIERGDAAPLSHKELMARLRE